MKIFLFFLFLAAAAGIFFLLNLLMRRLAYPIRKRYLHVRTVVAVFLLNLALTNVYSVSLLMSGADSVINSQALRAVFLAMLPNRSYELLYMILLLLLLNFMLTAAAILTVSLVRLFFRNKTEFVDVEEYYGVARLLRFPWAIARKFYRTEGDEVRLTGRGFTLGLWMRGIKNVFLILWAIETIVAGVSVLWAGEEWNQALLVAVRAWYILPMAGFLLAQQIQFFFETEYEGETTVFDSEAIGERLEGSVQLLMEFQKKAFEDADALLYAEYEEDGSEKNDGAHGNDLANTQIHDCRQPEILNIIAGQVKSSGCVMNAAYLNVIVELLNGNSVNVCDYVEGEFVPYLVAYLNFFMSQSKTALLLCPDRELADRLRETVSKTLSSMNSLYSVWNVCGIDDIRKDTYINMIVCAYDDFIKRRVIDKCGDFAENLAAVVCADCGNIFSQDSVHLELLFNSLGKIKARPRYIMLTGEDNDSLRTAMENYIKEELYPANNLYRRPKTGLMIWREESSSRLQRYLGIGNTLSPYLGTALPLALVAAKRDLPRVYIIPDRGRADKSYRDAMTMTAKEVKSYLGSGLNLDSVIRCKPSEALEQQDISMIIAYDTQCNFFNDLWRWMKYGGRDGTLVHIISPPYLLREYFAANFRDKKLYLKNNEFDALIPYSLVMRTSHLLVMLVSLCNSGMSEDELTDVIKRYDWDYGSVEELLTECLRVLYSDEEVHNVYECFHFETVKTFSEEKNGFVCQTRITLTDDTVRERLNAKIGFASIIRNNNRADTLTVFKNNIYNYFLRGQVIAYKGNFYRVATVTDGMVYVEQELSRDLLQYYPISRFTFDSDFHIKDACVDTDTIDFNLYAVSVTREIFGYWSSNCGTDFSNGHFVQVNDLRDETGAPVRTSMRHVSVLELNIRRTALGDRPVNAAVTLCCLLNGLFRTLFPASYQNLFAAATEAPDDSLLSEVLSRGTQADINSIIWSTIPTCVNARKVDPAFVSIYIIEFSCVEYGMTQILCNKFTSVLAMVREYLDWYLRSQVADAAQPDTSDVIRGRNLHFGQDTIPDIFACQELLDFCAKAAPEAGEDYEVRDDDAVEGYSSCTFCGKESLFVTRMEDGRVMCGSCKEHQLTRREEVRELFADTVAFMEKGYHINLPRKLHVRFRSAASIRKAAGDTVGGRILGFYNSANRQLWLESRGPKVAMLSTLIHELTHAWQYRELDMRALQRKLGGEGFLTLIEGHAVYTEINTLRKHNETEYADRLERITLLRDDEYGKGYVMVRDAFRDFEPDAENVNPFTAIKKLADSILKGEVSTP
ncbi:MAG: hypothetical protein IJ598_00160 [Ruminococcus sp.]|nr:hypothetical protein [Ruminococcus sp.]